MNKVQGDKPRSGRSSTRSRPPAATRSRRPKASWSATPTASRCRKEGVVSSAAEAAKLASSMGFPVVMKIVSPDILHKTEAGGVIVGVKSADEAATAYDTIIANAKKYKADANIVGVQVQQMIKGGQEVIVGADDRRQLRQAGGLRHGRRAGRGAQGRHLPPGAGDARKTPLSMLDGIQAAEMLKGVRGGEPVNREALANLIVRVSQLVTDFPEISEMDLNPVFASKEGAIAADVRIVVNFAPEGRRATARREGRRRVDEPHHEAQGGGGDRCFNEAGKIGNSVMKNLINGGYKGKIYPIHPKDAEILGHKAYKSVKDVPGRDRHRGVRDSREVRGRRAEGMRREEDRRRGADPVGLRRDRQHRRPGRTAAHRPRVQHPPDGPEHLRLLLHAGQPVRHVLHGLRLQGLHRAVLAVRRHRHGHHRLLALRQDGRVGHRRPGQQVGHRRGRPAALLRAGRQHQGDRAALRRPEGRPRLRRGRQARLEEEAGDHAQGGPHRGGRRRCQLAHRRAGRQRQDLRRRAAAVRRDPRPQPAPDAGLRARRADPAHAQGRERGDHHGRRRLRRAAVRRLRGQRPEAAQADARRPGRGLPQVHPAVRRGRQPGGHHRRRAAHHLREHGAAGPGRRPHPRADPGLLAHHRHAAHGVRQEHGARSSKR